MLAAVQALLFVPAVIVLLNGSMVPAVPPAEVIGGRVMVPLAPVVTRFAERVTVDAGGTIVIEVPGHRCTLRLGVAEAVCDNRARPLELAPFVREGVPFVPVADVVRAFGGTIAFDPGSATVDLRLAPERGVESPAPFDPAAPSVTPTMLFTPQPPPPSPRPTDSAVPRPRRTAIPVIPP
jgi:hypothetical protein